MAVAVIFEPGGNKKQKERRCVAFTLRRSFCLPIKGGRGLAAAKVYGWEKFIEKEKGADAGSSRTR
jgi:hypothetical protein